LASPAPKQPHSLCKNLSELKLHGMQCSERALGTLYAALPNLVALELNSYHLESPFFAYLFTMRFDDDDPGAFLLPKLNFLKTYGISGQRMRTLINIRSTIKHVRMDSKADIDEEEEEWLRAHTESFDFFENSDDEDSESSVLIFDPDQDQDQDSGSEGDEVPEEWVDDDDDDSME